MNIVYGMGNPLMDIIVSGNHSVLSELGVVAGSMNLSEESKSGELLTKCKLLTRLAGGSCANTMRAIAWLSERNQESIDVHYSGAVGKDLEGELFGKILSEQNVKPLLALKDMATGNSTIVVTPDHERTMFTCLGACRGLDEHDLDFSLLEKSRIFHTTGYMWDSPNQENAAKQAINYCREHGIMVSFDISDPFVAKRYGEELIDWLPGKIDILFANRDELVAMTCKEGDDDDIIHCAGNFADIVVMKVGERGCLLMDRGEVQHITGVSVDARDTTGAGDTFAGGFLYGMLTGKSLIECAAMANRIAAAMVTVEGCNFSLIGDLI